MLLLSLRNAWQSTAENQNSKFSSTMRKNWGVHLYYYIHSQKIPSLVYGIKERRNRLSFSTNFFPELLNLQVLSNNSLSSNMSTVSVALSNTGDSIIRVEIPSANFNQFITASSIVNVTLNIGQTYNIKLTEGRTVKNSKYVWFQGHSSSGSIIERIWLIAIPLPPMGRRWRSPGTSSEQIHKLSWK